MTGKWWLVVGALLGLTGVGLGAFGAHGLETMLDNWGLDQAEQMKRLDNWETATRYQMYHALALLAVGLLALSSPRRTFHAAGAAFTFGVLFFSGCLFAYVLSGAKAFAMPVPIGGVLLMAGWLLLLVGVLRVDAAGKRECHQPNANGERGRRHGSQQ